jgi:hypothetical protein
MACGICNILVIHIFLAVWFFVARFSITGGVHIQENRTLLFGKRPAKYLHSDCFPTSVLTNRFKGSGFTFSTTQVVPPLVVIIA